MASSSGTSSGIFRQLTSPIGTLTHSACPPGYPPVKWLYPKNPASAWSALGFPPYLEYQAQIEVKECISRDSSSRSLHPQDGSRDSHGPHQRRVVSPITEARQLYHHFVEDKQKQRQKKGDSERSYVSSGDGFLAPRCRFALTLLAESAFSTGDLEGGDDSVTDLESDVLDGHEPAQSVYLETERNKRHSRGPPSSS
jgi:hypothetical protein